MPNGKTEVRRTDSSVRAWRWISTLLAVTQLATPPVITRVFGDFLSSGATNRALITPSGYAFSIWGLITLLTVATGVAILRYGLGSTWETRVLVELSVVYTGFSTWLVVAAQDWLWLSVAVFVNVAAAAIRAGAPADAVGWQAGVLVAATVTAVVLTALLRGSPGYVAAVAWALVAAAIGAAHRGSTVLAVASAVAILVVVGTAALQGVGTRVLRHTHRWRGLREECRDDRHQ